LKCSVVKCLLVEHLDSQSLSSFSTRLFSYFKRRHE
jgi:hypothetical protein